MIKTIISMFMLMAVIVNSYAVSYINVVNHAKYAIDVSMPNAKENIPPHSSTVVSLGHSERKRVLVIFDQNKEIIIKDTGKLKMRPTLKIPYYQFTISRGNGYKEGDKSISQCFYLEARAPFYDYHFRVNYYSPSKIEITSEEEMIAC